MSKAEEAQREFFERLAGRYDSRFCRSRWPRNQRLKARLVAEALADALHEGPVLEIGCGTGQVAGELLEENPNLRYVGVDLSPAMLEVARRRLVGFGDRVSLRVSEGGKLPTDEDLAAGAFGIDVLHHVDEPQELLQQLCATLSPGAPVIFLEANPIFPMTALLGVTQKEERGVFRMRTKVLTSWFELAGFDLVDVVLGPVYTPPGPQGLWGALDRIDRTFARTPLVRHFALYLTARARAPGA
jgi:ubiquinone/menaquinone biosynthesis C-methylase UbiE